MTIWKDISGYEGYYRASDDGRIKSVRRFYLRSNGRKHSVRERILKPALNADGYLKCALMRDGKLKTYRVHRLIALIFYGVANGREVNHIDGVKTNNNIGNLEYCTHRENAIHSHKTGLQISLKGSQVWNAKLKEYEIPMIRRFMREGIAARALARLYGMDKSVFMDIRSNKIWRHV